MVGARAKRLSTSLVSPAVRQKFRAWWHGTAIDSRAGGGAETRTHLSTPPPRSAATRDDGLLLLRLMLAELLWGEGRLGPGDDSLIVEPALGLGLTAKKGIAFLGVGLGGAARTLAEKTGVWVEGFEAHRRIAELGAKQCAAHASGSKVTVRAVDPEALKLPKGKFSDLVSREALGAVGDKTRLLAEIAGAVKPGGSLLTTEWVALCHPLGADESAALGLPCAGRSELLSADALADMIKAAGFDISASENMTPLCLPLIAEGWGQLARIVSRFTEASLGKHAFALCLRVIAEEAEIWARRFEACRRERIALQRITAVKRR